MARPPPHVRRPPRSLIWRPPSLARTFVPRPACKTTGAAAPLTPTPRRRPNGPPRRARHGRGRRHPRWKRPRPPGAQTSIGCPARRPQGRATRDPSSHGLPCRRRERGRVRRHPWPRLRAPRRGTRRRPAHPRRRGRTKFNSLSDPLLRSQHIFQMDKEHQGEDVFVFKINYINNSVE